MAESKVNRSDINKFKLEVLLNRNIYQTKKSEALPHNRPYRLHEKWRLQVTFPPDFHFAMQSSLCLSLKGDGYHVHKTEIRFKGLKMPLQQKTIIDGYV